LTDHSAFAARACPGGPTRCRWTSTPICIEVALLVATNDPTRTQRIQPEHQL